MPPVEAAILWGATHIILVEASTEEFVPRGALLANVGAALNYLYDEAQLIDKRSHGQVTIFSLVPRPPHIGLLDFSDNLLAQGIRKGYREARGEIGGELSVTPTFKKELGKPIFWEPQPL